MNCDGGIWEYSQRHNVGTGFFRHISFIRCIVGLFRPAVEKQIDEFQYLLSSSLQQLANVDASLQEDRDNPVKQVLSFGLLHNCAD